MGHAVKEQVKEAASAGFGIAVAIAELITSKIKLRQAQLEAQRVALLDKLNAALDEPPKE